MRSAYGKILLLSVGILALSLGAFLIQSRLLSCREFDQEGPIRRDMFRQFYEAKAAYQSGGKATLAAYLDAEKGVFPGVRLFLLKDGRDLVTGADRSHSLSEVNGWRRYRMIGPSIRAIPSAESEYALLIVLPAPGMSAFLPYYYLIAAVVVIFCGASVFQFAAPLQALKDTVMRFGAGNLSARVHSTRKDEFGELSCAFDEMANRTERLLNAERRLLQDISHEIRSPLARLRFAVAVGRTSSDRFATAARIDKEIERIAELLDSVLQVTRAENDPGLKTAVTVNLHSLISDLTDDCELEANATGCGIQITGRADVVLFCDRELLRRAVENVLRNAIRHAPRGSSVNIDIDCRQTAVVAVRDYGPGVPADDLLNIFAPFFRVDASRNKSTGGVGLGLAIADRAVRVLGGTVWAENAGPGLRVIIELPLGSAPLDITLQQTARNA